MISPEVELYLCINKTLILNFIANFKVCGEINLLYLDAFQISEAGCEGSHPSASRTILTANYK